MFYRLNTIPRFPPFLLYVRFKSGVTFVRRCFRDAVILAFASSVNSLDNLCTKCSPDSLYLNSIKILFTTKNAV